MNDEPRSLEQEQLVPCTTWELVRYFLELGCFGFGCPAFASA